jgi:hypothetical protein
MAVALRRIFGRKYEIRAHQNFNWASTIVFRGKNHNIVVN